MCQGNDCVRLDRDRQTLTIPIDLTVYRSKLALTKRNYDEVLPIIRNWNLVGQAIILKTISSYTAFSRQILILRALHFNNNKPSLTDEEWLSLDTTLDGLIFGAYGKTNNIKVALMTQSEIRDIILSMKTSAPSLPCRRISEIEKRAKNSLQLTVMTVKARNIHGDEVISRPRH
ncbi:pre-mRNA-splicing factor 8, partial [Modicella reniformis]